MSQLSWFNGAALCRFQAQAYSHKGEERGLPLWVQHLTGQQQQAGADGRSVHPKPRYTT
jgi:hypothetical protein